MRKGFMLALLVTVPLQAQTAADLVRGAINAMGGEERLHSIHVVELKAIGHRNALDDRFTVWRSAQLLSNGCCGLSDSRDGGGFCVFRAGAAGVARRSGGCASK